MKFKKNKLIDRGNTDWWLQRWRSTRVCEMDEGVKRYKLPVTRLVSHGEVSYDMVTLVGQSVLYILKLLKD